jgi:hypothetical protein
MDTIAQRRMQIAKMEQDAAAADEKEKYNRQVESRKEAYGNRKQDVIEKRDNANELFKQEEHNAKQRKYVRDQVGSGRNPGTVTYWKDGQPVTAQYTFEGGHPIERPAPSQDMVLPAPAAAEPPAQPVPEPQGQPVPTMMGKPLMQSTLGQGPGQLPVQPQAPAPQPSPPPEQAQAPAQGQSAPPQNQPDPQLEALMSRASQPQQPPPQAARDNTIFLDENDEGATRALLPPGDTGRADLPMRAYPEGAKEGDRFAAEDVNLKGGYGNPFAEPVPPAEMPQPNRDAGGTNNLLGVQSPTSTSTFVPGRDIQGASATMPQQSGGGRWVARDKSGAEFDSVDMGEARKAKDDEDARQLQAINDALASPEAKVDPRLSQALITDKVSLLGRMSPDARKTLFAMQKQGQQIESNEGMLDKRLAAQRDIKEMGGQQATDLEKLKQEGKLAIQRSKHKGGSGLFGGQKIVADGGEYIPIPQTRFGSRPDMLMGRVDNEWAKYSADEKLNTSLFTVRRLQLAKNNIEANGPNSGVLNMEAAFNFLGAVRGGVPVENETKKMLDNLRTWGDELHGRLANAGLGEAYERVVKGGKLTEKEANRARNVMSTGEQARIREGIDESLNVATAQVQNQLKPFTDIAAQYGGPGGHLMRQHAVGLVNARIKTTGVEGEYNPFTDTKVGSESPFLKKQQDAGAPAGGKKPSLREALFPGQ